MDERPFYHLRKLSGGSTVYQPVNAALRDGINEACFSLLAAGGTPLIQSALQSGRLAKRDRQEGIIKQHTLSRLGVI